MPAAILSYEDPIKKHDIDASRYIYENVSNRMVYMNFPDGTCIALMPNTFSRVFDYNRDLWIKGETE